MEDDLLVPQQPVNDDASRGAHGTGSGNRPHRRRPLARHALNNRCVEALHDVWVPARVEAKRCCQARTTVGSMPASRWRRRDPAPRLRAFGLPGRDTWRPARLAGPLREPAGLAPCCASPGLGSSPASFGSSAERGAASSTGATRRASSIHGHGPAAGACAQQPGILHSMASSGPCSAFTPGAPG